MKLNLDRSEFSDLIILILYNAIKDNSFMTSNPRFNDIIETFKQKGIKSDLFKYFLDTPSEMRTDFKRFKPILQSDSKKPGTIFLYPGFNDIIKEIAEIITGKQLNEDKVNTILKQLIKD